MDGQRHEISDSDLSLFLRILRAVNDIALNLWSVACFLGGEFDNPAAPTPTNHIVNVAKRLDTAITEANGLLSHNPDASEIASMTPTMHMLTQWVGAASDFKACAYDEIIDRAIMMLKSKSTTVDEVVATSGVVMSLVGGGWVTIRGHRHRVIG